MKYTRNVKRKKFSEEYTNIIFDIFDELLPFFSGREFRLRTLPLHDIYKKVEDLCQQRSVKKPSFSFFYNHFILTEKIHKMNCETFCPHCKLFLELQRIALGLLNAEKAHLYTQLEGHEKERSQRSEKHTDCQQCKDFCKIENELISKLSNEDQNEYKKLKQHRNHLFVQRKMFKNDKNDIINNKCPHTCLIIMDFSQLQTQGDFRQDLIVCVYKYVPLEGDGNQKVLKTYHIVADKSQRNDVKFVIGSMMNLFINNEDILQNVSHLKIWTDGAAKHFKQTLNLYFWNAFRDHFKLTQITYNFFISYHGFNCCDAAAAIVKKSLNRYQSLNRTPLKTQNQTIQVINQNVENHQAEKATFTTKPKIVTFQTISSQHQFVYTSSKPDVIKYKVTSDPDLPFKEFNLSQVDLDKTVQLVDPPMTIEFTNEILDSDEMQAFFKDLNFIDPITDLDYITTTPTN